MATNNYDTMSTKKLEALLEAAEADANEELTPEEAEALAYAEEHDGENPMYKRGAAAKETKANKRTPEELDLLADTCKLNIGHKCEVVPFGTIEYAPGVITGIFKDARAGNVLYIVTLDDGRKVRKVQGSALLKISDETVEIVRKTRVLQKEAMARWTPEELEAKLAEARENVGKLLTFEGGQGYIASVVADKRVNLVLYRVRVVGEDGTAKIVHKSAFGTVQFTIAEERDEEGQAIYEALKKRGQKAEAQPANLEEALAKAEEALAKAEETKAKAEERIAKAMAKIEALKAELASQIDKDEQETQEALA